MTLSPVNPKDLAAPIGFSHGMKGSGELLFVAGQIGWDREGRLVSEELVAQFGQALDNVLAVVTAAGGEASSIGRLTLYVTDKASWPSAWLPRRRP